MWNALASNLLRYRVLENIHLEQGLAFREQRTDIHRFR